MLYVAIVEDNPKAAELIREYIEGDDVCVTGVYHSGEEALEHIPNLPLPDVLLVDIGLPGISGVEVTRQIKQRFPQVEVVIQSVFEDAGNIVSAIKAGASGYILKASKRSEIINALQQAKTGGAFLNGKVARKVLAEFRASDAGAIIANAARRFELTEREETILKKLAAGLSYKMTADMLGISIHTVNNHARTIYEKMRVNSRSEAIATLLDYAP